MKIRTDFVTNSSSVSYIITMYMDMVDSYMKFFSIEKDKPDSARIIKTLIEDMLKNGTCVFLEGKEIITKKIKFGTDETIDESYRETPIDKMDDDELWSYIFGEYILNGKLNGVWGFGVTQIETY